MTHSASGIIVSAQPIFDAPSIAAIFKSGFWIPQRGQAFAMELTSDPHSLQETRATPKPPWYH
jgi:hypothetical protein